MPSNLTSIFGRFYGEVGSTDKDLILNTRGEVKVRVGKKFFNLFKDGKVSGISDSSSISFTEDISQETSNGFYIDSLGSIYLIYDGTTYELGGKGQTSYVSFNDDQEVTRDQKEKALKNIGFYYDTLEEAEEVSQGIVYVKDKNALYINIDGELKNYLSESGALDKLIISDGSKSLTITPTSIEGLKNIGDSIEFLSEGIIVNSILNLNGNFRLDQDGLEVNKLFVSDLTINMSNMFSKKIPSGQEPLEEDMIYIGETPEERFLNNYYIIGINKNNQIYSGKLNYYERLYEETIGGEQVTKILGLFTFKESRLGSGVDIYLNGLITETGYFYVTSCDPEIITE